MIQSNRSFETIKELFTKNGFNVEDARYDSKLCLIEVKHKTTGIIFTINIKENDPAEVKIPPCCVELLFSMENSGVRSTM